MMSDPFFSQLLLVGLLWRYLMRSVVWPDDHATAGHSYTMVLLRPPYAGGVRVVSHKTFVFET
jgi:hypothetical protein